MLFSTFSLRPPLPATYSRINDDSRAITTTTQQQQLILTATQMITSSDKNNDLRKSKLSRRISQRKFCTVKSSFLFRMYVACHILRLTTETRFTALVLLHRYTQAKNEVASPRYYDNDEEEKNSNVIDENERNLPWIGAVCLFLACKTEEEPRRLRDVVNMARMVLSSSSTLSTSKTKIKTPSLSISNKTIVDDVILSMNLSKPPSLNEEEYWDSKKKVIETEQMVLRWLGFDCSVSHPHRAIYWILEKEIEASRFRRETQEKMSNIYEPLLSSSLLDENNLRLTIPTPKKQKYDNTSYINDNNNFSNVTRNKLLPLAFRRLNDALFYPKALRWGVVELACAALDLATYVSEVSEVNDEDDAATSNTSVIHDNEIGNHSYGSISSNNKLIFQKEWWKRYDVSNEALDGCKNSLKEATSYLKTVNDRTIT